MDSYQIVSKIAAAGNLRFLLVGGNAMILHGSDRITADLDIAIPEADAPEWKTQLTEAGFAEFHATDAFIRFRPPSSTHFPVDLVIVDPRTFEKLWQRSQTGTVVNVEVRIPHPRHLIAMKLHALKHGGERRISKDFGDVLTLMRVCQIRPDDVNFQESVKKYGTPEIEDKIRRALKGPS